MKDLLKFSILFNLFLLSPGRYFHRCELGLTLLNNGIAYSKLSDFVCLARTLSRSNSSFVSGYDTNPNNNLQYGIFQIGNYYFCWDEYKQVNNECNLNCTDLIDDDLEDDIRCARRIYRGGGNSLKKWGPGVSHCENSPNLLEDCDLLKGQPPTVLNDATNVTLTLQNYSMGSLRCDVSGTPPISVEWWKNERKISRDTPLYEFTSGFDDKENVTNSIMRFLHNATKEGVDRYTCKSKNIYGEDDKDFLLRIIDPSKIQDSDPNSLKKILISTGATAVVLAMIFFVVYKLFIKDYGGLNRKEIKLFENGTTTPGTTESEYIHESIGCQPYNKDFEIKEDDFRLDRNKVLGSGQYGIVYKGTHKGKPVAVKTIKPGAGKVYLSALLVELKVMIYIKGHPNIVNVIGASTRGLKKGSVFVVVEYCPLGSLLEYLQQFRERRSNSITASTHYVQVDTELQTNNEYTDPTKLSNLQNTNICERHMMSWAYQLSSGMEYLASKKVIHGDLACRNILMQDAQTIKITDFGLSRKLYDYATYVKADQEPLPWRWLAIETMHDLKFSTQSDVWSYGITLWEIFSLGQKPYPGLEWSLDFIKRIDEGFRMDKPDAASESIYQLMRECWHEISGQRPTFASIREKMCQELKKFSAFGGYVELDFLHQPA